MYIETEVYFELDELDQEEIKMYAMDNFNLVEGVEEDKNYWALEFLEKTKKETSQCGEWINIREKLKELIKE